MSNIIYDLQAESQVSLFLDTYFYPKVCKEFERVTDRKRQLKGIDVIIKLDNKELLVDEKAQTNYINRGLNTYAFELEFINKNGNQRCGWLISDDKDTEAYMLIYLKANKTKGFTVDDITEAECLLISKESILEYLESQDYTKEKLQEQTKNIREGTDVGRIMVNKTNIYFFLSHYLSEKPINVIIKKDTVLDKICEKRFIVTKKEVVTKK